MTRLADPDPVRWLGRRLDCPRAGLDRTATGAADQAPLRRAIERVAGAGPADGDRRLTAMLRRDEGSVNAPRVRRVRRPGGLAAEPPPRRRRTPASDPPFPRSANLLGDRSLTRPDPLRVADSPAVRVRAEWVDLAVIRAVVPRGNRGRALSRSLDRGLTPAARGRAVRRGRPGIPPSDPGGQDAPSAEVEPRGAVGAALRRATGASRRRPGSPSG